MTYFTTEDTEITETRMLIHRDKFRRPNLYGVCRGEQGASVFESVLSVNRVGGIGETGGQSREGTRPEGREMSEFQIRGSSFVSELRCGNYGEGWAEASTNAARVI